MDMRVVTASFWLRCSNRKLGWSGAFSESYDFIFFLNLSRADANFV